MRTSARTPVYHNVSRERTELNIFPLVSILRHTRATRVRAPLFVRWNAQLVPRPPPGVDERHAERLVNLSAQTINVDFYEFGEGVERIVPDVLGDVFAP